MYLYLLSYYDVVTLPVFTNSVNLQAAYPNDAATFPIVPNRVVMQKLNRNEECRVKGDT